MDLTLSPIENLKAIKKELEIIKFNKDIKNLSSLIKRKKNEMKRLTVMQNLGTPMEYMEYANEIRDINYTIQVLERRFKQLNLTRVDIDGGEEYLGFAKQKLSYLKGMMWEAGMDVGRQKYYIGDDEDDSKESDRDIEVLVQSHKGYDLIRISAGEILHVDRLFLHNDFGTGANRGSSISNPGYLQVYDIIKEDGDISLQPSEQLQIEYYPMYGNYYYNLGNAIQSMTKKDKQNAVHYSWRHYNFLGLFDPRQKDDGSDWSFFTPYSVMSPSVSRSPEDYNTWIGIIVHSAEGTATEDSIRSITNTWGYNNDILEKLYHNNEGHNVWMTDREFRFTTIDNFTFQSGDDLHYSHTATYGGHDKSVVQVAPLTFPFPRYVLDYDIRNIQDTYVIFYKVATSFAGSFMEEDGGYIRDLLPETNYLGYKMRQWNNLNQGYRTTTKMDYYIAIKTKEKLIQELLCTTNSLYTSGTLISSSTYTPNTRNPDEGNISTYSRNDYQQRSFTGKDISGISCQICDNKYLVYTYNISKQINVFSSMSGFYPILGLEMLPREGEECVIGIIDLVTGGRKEFSYSAFTEVPRLEYIKKSSIGEDDKDYFFRICAFNPLMTSVLSEEIQVTLSKGEVANIVWNKIEGATGYIVFKNGYQWKVIMGNENTSMSFMGTAESHKEDLHAYTGILYNEPSIGIDLKLSKVVK